MSVACSLARSLGQPLPVYITVVAQDKHRPSSSRFNDDNEFEPRQKKQRKQTNKQTNARFFLPRGLWFLSVPRIRGWGS
jgi:hypothetical protein